MQHIATWNSDRRIWELPAFSLCGHQEPYLDAFPVSGSMRGGVLSETLTPGDGAGSPYSSALLKTPIAGDAKGTANATAVRLGPSAAHAGTTLTDVMRQLSPELLPTPAAGNFNDGESLATWEARRQRNLAKGINGNGQGTPLSVAVRQVAEAVDLLPTPAATLGSNGGLVTDAKGRDGGTLIEALSLLKTPTAQLATNGGSQDPGKRRAGGHGPTLADQVEHDLLPTPAARVFRSGKSHIMDRNARPLNEVIETGLLPTPQVADVTGGHRTRSGARRNELLLPGVAKELGMTPVVDWGKYARAILRWQQVLGRMVPHPLTPGKNGNWVLSPAFVSWMMGLPDGWVTGVPGLSRTDHLRLLGNGVVPQQACFAIDVLWERVGYLLGQAAALWLTPLRTASWSCPPSSAVPGRSRRWTGRGTTAWSRSTSPTRCRRSSTGC